MNAVLDKADLFDVENTERGARIKARRQRMGIKSVRALHEATGIDRAAIANAEKGEGTDYTFDRLEAWLDAKEHEMSSEADEASEHDDRVVTIKMAGVYGIEDVTISGPVDHLSELKNLAVELMRDVRERSNDE